MFSRQELKRREMMPVGGGNKNEIYSASIHSPTLSRISGPLTSGVKLPDGLLSDIIENASDAIFIADIRGDGEPIVHVNAAFETITGHSHPETIEKAYHDLQGGDRLRPEMDRVRNALTAGQSCKVRLDSCREDGSPIWRELHLLPLGTCPERPTHYAGVIRDVTDLVEAGLLLHQAMQTDRLTGCLNRDALRDALGSLCATNSVLLVKVDVARFHDINSGYGYDIGDALLVEISARLHHMNPDVIGRVSGDEFAVAFSLNDRAEVPARLEHITRALNARYDLPGTGLTVRFSTGFAVGTVGSEARPLLRQAGAALAQSKSSLLRAPHEYETDSEERARTRVRLTGELQHAIFADEFLYHYQPKIDLLTGEFIGAEALLRWQRGVTGIQPPGHFLRLAEETGLILDIGAKGFYEIAAFATRVNRWRRRPLRFAINVSAIEFTHRDMVSFVSDVLEKTGADPAWLTLELTESLIATDSAEMRDIFKCLRALGVGLSIDDFGTEYSSLRYLEQFPITEIKIDRSFVTDLQHSATKRIIVASVIQLGAELGLDIVAEGIEHESERALLRAMNCPFGQGNHFSRPLPPEEFAILARNGTLSPAPRDG